MPHKVQISDFVSTIDLSQSSNRDICHPGSCSGQNFGNYLLLDVIGHGASSEVYKAVSASHFAAVKILPQTSPTSDLARTRFDLEIAILSDLDHPGIIPLYESGEQNGIPYMALEYVEGQTLMQLLRQYGRLLPETCCALVSDCTAGLEYVHTRGIIHGDIKPANIMLRSTHDGQLKPLLTDFSIAQILDDETTSLDTPATGTIAYMSPEQIRPEQHMDHRVDIYALGVMLYEMLTGELPFEGNPAEMISAHLDQPAPNPQHIVPNVSDHLALAVQKAMAKDADERFQSASEMAAALF